jgi:hypothetical protein
MRRNIRLTPVSVVLGALLMVAGAAPPGAAW